MPWTSNMRMVFSSEGVTPSNHFDDAWTNAVNAGTGYSVLHRHREDTYDHQRFAPDRIGRRSEENARDARARPRGQRRIRASPEIDDAGSVGAPCRRTRRFWIERPHTIGPRLL